MLPLSPLSRGHGKWVQNKQKVEVYFEPEVSFTAESGHIWGPGGGGGGGGRQEECSLFPSGAEPCVFGFAWLVRWWGSVADLPC